MTTALKDCFSNAERNENHKRKHKGLLVKSQDPQKAEAYLKKAKENLELCKLYKERGFDYKLPEEWFHTMYYCALAILARFGVDSRSQRCTALFLRYAKDKGLIDYDDEFIHRITVHKDKGRMSDVDERENARYGPYVKSKGIIEKHELMIGLCRECIFQCRKIVFSNVELCIPKDMSLR